MCKSIDSYDGNALYLSFFSENMHTGHFDKQIYPDFKPIRTDECTDICYWMDYLNSTNIFRISNKMKNGKEKGIGPYLVEGIDHDARTIYEYNGYYFHGHECI